MWAPRRPVRSRRRRASTTSHCRPRPRRPRCRSPRRPAPGSSRRAPPHARAGSSRRPRRRRTGWGWADRRRPDRPARSPSPELGGGAVRRSVEPLPVAAVADERQRIAGLRLHVARHPPGVGDPDRVRREAVAAAVGQQRRRHERERVATRQAGCGWSVRAGWVDAGCGRGSRGRGRERAHARGEGGGQAGTRVLDHAWLLWFVGRRATGQETGFGLHDLGARSNARDTP